MTANLEIENQRQEEREALLQRIVAMLKEDRRVAAAWLGGSLGRGEADDLSDIDLSIAVSDAYAKFLYAARHEFVQRVEGVLLIEEAPQHAPSDGAYLLTLFRGETGPHQVDWYWQMESTTTIPAATQVLFNPNGLPQALPEPEYREFSVEEVTNRLAFFWAMVGIAAKKIARRHVWAAITILSNLQRTLDELAWEVRMRSRPGHSDQRTQPPPVEPAELLGMLTKTATLVAGMHPELRSLGVAVPEGIDAEMQKLLDLTAAILTKK